MGNRETLKKKVKKEKVVKWGEEKGDKGKSTRVLGNGGMTAEVSLRISLESFF